MNEDRNKIDDYSREEDGRPEPGKLLGFFVPHEGNGFKPDSLHPKRLAFHAVAALVTKLIVFIFAASFPLEAWLTPDVLMAENKKIISLTNEVRASLGVARLSESSLLDEVAYAKAKDMLINQYFDHVSPAKIGLSAWLKRFSYDYRAAGENLAMGFSGAAEVVEAWKKSPTHYSNLIDPDFSEIGVGAVAGLFEKEETTLVAQFFGHPADAASAAPEAIPAGDQTPPQVDFSRTSLTVDPIGEDKLLVKAVAYLSPDTKKGEIVIGDDRLELRRDGSDLNRWTAEQLIFQDEGRAPVILPSLAIEDYYGNAAKTAIRYENVKPAGIGSLDQYLFFREHRSAAMASIFDLSSFYFRMLLAFLAISLLMNIFIEIRKQHPHVIFSTLGVMALLVILIIL